MNRQVVERYQLVVAVLAIAGGWALGRILPGVGSAVSVLLWPLLGALLYASFVQVPVQSLADGWRDRRFLVALLLGNVVVIPLLVAGLLGLVPDDPALRLGVVMVLVMPCTDWFITFTQLGRGDTGRAVASLPILLAVQVPLLPVACWVLLGGDTVVMLATRDVVTAALAIIVLPLVAAVLTHRWIAGDARRHPWTERLAILPVPLLALVLFVIAAGQAEAVRDHWHELLAVVPAFVLYVIAVVPIAWLVARCARLPAPAARTLLFSFGTRNSFLVLPVAVVLPEARAVAVLVIVAQSVIELLGMLVYVVVAPRWFR